MNSSVNENMSNISPVLHTGTSPIIQHLVLKGCSAFLSRAEAGYVQIVKRASALKMNLK